MHSIELYLTDGMRIPFSRVLWFTTKDNVLMFEYLVDTQTTTTGSVATGTKTLLYPLNRVNRLEIFSIAVKSAT
jgi:hypothetical protein